MKRRPRHRTPAVEIVHRRSAHTRNEVICPNCGTTAPIARIGYNRSSYSKCDNCGKYLDNNEVKRE